jgi:hypothetical protein
LNQDLLLDVLGRISQQQIVISCFRLPRRGFDIEITDAPCIEIECEVLRLARLQQDAFKTMSAENTSRWLYPLRVRLFGPIGTPHWAEVHHLIRKTGHFIGYGGVSVAFLYGCLRTLHLWRRAAFLAVSCTLLIATLDEYHQSFCRAERVPQSMSASTSAGPLQRNSFFSWPFKLPRIVNCSELPKAPAY